MKHNKSNWFVHQEPYRYHYKPIEPHKRILIQKTICYVWQSVLLKEHLSEIEKHNIKLEDVGIGVDKCDDSPVYLFYNQEIDNPNYKKLMRDYDKQLVEYEKAEAKYQEQLVEYKAWKKVQLEKNEQQDIKRAKELLRKRGILK